MNMVWSWSRARPAVSFSNSLSFIKSNGGSPSVRLSQTRIHTHIHTQMYTFARDCAYTEAGARIHMHTDRLHKLWKLNVRRVVRVLENVSWTRHSSRLRLLLDRPDSAILSDDGGDATCLTQRTSVTSGSRLGNLDGARRNAAATATEVVRSQGPPRRATVIPASRTSPATTSSENDDDYLTRVATWKGRRHGWLKITRTFVALGSTSARNFILLWELETWKPFYQKVDWKVPFVALGSTSEILYFCGNCWRDFVIKVGIVKSSAGQVYYLTVLVPLRAI